MHTHPHNEAGFLKRGRVSPEEGDNFRGNVSTVSPPLTVAASMVREPRAVSVETNAESTYLPDANVYHSRSKHKLCAGVLLLILGELVWGILEVNCVTRVINQCCDQTVPPKPKAHETAEPREASPASSVSASVTASTPPSPPPTQSPPPSGSPSAQVSPSPTMSSSPTPRPLEKSYLELMGISTFFGRFSWIHNKVEALFKDQLGLGSQGSWDKAPVVEVCLEAPEGIAFFDVETASNVSSAFVTKGNLTVCVRSNDANGIAPEAFVSAFNEVSGRPRVLASNLCGRELTYASKVVNNVYGHQVAVDKPINGIITCSVGRRLGESFNRVLSEHSPVAYTVRSVQERTHGYLRGSEASGLSSQGRSYLAGPSGNGVSASGSQLSLGLQAIGFIENVLPIWALLLTGFSRQSQPATEAKATWTPEEQFFKELYFEGDAVKPGEKAKRLNRFFRKQLSGDELKVIEALNVHVNELELMRHSEHGRFMALLEAEEGKYLKTLKGILSEKIVSHIKTLSDLQVAGLSERQYLGALKDQVALSDRKRVGSLRGIKSCREKLDARQGDLYHLKRKTGLNEADFERVLAGAGRELRQESGAMVWLESWRLSETARKEKDLQAVVQSWRACI